MYASETRLHRSMAIYLEHMKERGLSTKYVQESGRVLRDLRDYCLDRGIDSMRELTIETLKEYQAEYQHMSLSHQRMISTIIRGWLSDQDSPLALKFKLRLYGSERTRVDWLEKEDCQRVLDSIDPNVPNESILICGALLCGLRRVEMLRMTVADAEEAVRTKKLRVVGKCHKIRPIPIGEGYRSILRDYLRTRTDAGKNDRLLTCGRSRSEFILSRFRKRTGIQFYGYHTLRRSYLRMLWKEKVPIETLAQLAGHESTDMTKEYIGVNMDDMTGAIQLLPVEIRTKPMTAR